MQNITTSVNENRRAGVRRMVKHSSRIDMTPMVDLGFLLITFFVMTAELARPTVMNLYMPKDGPPSDLAESKAVTVLLSGNNSIYYYTGKWKNAFEKNEIHKINFGGGNSLRKFLTHSQQLLQNDLNNKEGKDGMMVLIKPSANSSYKKVVDVLDEMTISLVKKYALVKITSEETTWLEGQNSRY